MIFFSLLVLHHWQRNFCRLSYSHRNPPRPLPCTDSPEQKLIRKEGKAQGKSKSSHLCQTSPRSEFCLSQWHQSKANLRANRGENNVFNTQDLQGEPELSEWFCSQQSVKTAPCESLAVPRTQICQLQQQNQPGFVLELQIQAGSARGSSIPPRFPSSQDTLSEILPPSPIPGTDVGTGRSPARCSGPSPRLAKRHQGCPDKGAEFSHPKNSPRTVLSFATCHELHFLAKSGGKRGKDLSCTTPLTRSFILLFL